MKFLAIIKRPLAVGEGIKAGQRGMSLIQIIIVVALLGTLMAYMVSNLIGQSEYRLSWPSLTSAGHLL